MRNRGWRRKKNFSKAKRKRDIDIAINFNSWFSYAENHCLYNSLNEYSKNKIHCSCGLCATKTRNKGHRRYLPKNYSPSIDYSRYDKRKYDSMIEEEREFIYGEENNSIME